MCAQTHRIVFGDQIRDLISCTADVTSKQTEEPFHTAPQAIMAAVGASQHSDTSLTIFNYRSEQSCSGINVAYVSVAACLAALNSWQKLELECLSEIYFPICILQLQLYICVPQS